MNERDRTAVLLHVVDGRAITRAGTATWSWLTPAPEPEPDEPTAPGALVRDGEGVLWARDTTSMKPWVNLDGHSDDAWPNIPRPITVVLADPAKVEELRKRVAILTADRQSAEAEVETLRAEVESSGREVKAALDRARMFKIERDEFDRTIDRALNELTRVGGTVHLAVTILRGES